MIRKYIFMKIVETVIKKISQGDGRGLLSYVKKTALGVAVVAFILSILLIVGFIFLIYILISGFTNIVNIESLSATKSMAIIPVA